MNEDDLNRLRDFLINPYHLNYPVNLQTTAILRFGSRSTNFILGRINSEDVNDTEQNLLFIIQLNKHMYPY